MNCPACGMSWGTGWRLPMYCVCGNSFTSLDGVTIKPIPPDMVRRGGNYIRAWARWTAAGMPRRTPVEVDHIRFICRECEFFDGDICTHKRCGCSVKQGRWWGDKVAWATEHCPVEKW